jgi:HEAT repeat protein
MPPSLLADRYRRVRNRTASALAKIGDERALRPLAHLLESDPDPKLIQAVAAALERLAESVPPTAADRTRAVDALRHVLRRGGNVSIRTATVSALAAFRDDRVLPDLEKTLKQSLQEGQPTLSEATVRALAVFGPEHAKRGRRRVSRYRLGVSQRRLACVLNPDLPLEQRCWAAEALGETDAATAQEALRRLCETPQTPGELRASVLAALGRMNPELADRLAAEPCPGTGNLHSPRGERPT